MTEYPFAKLTTCRRALRKAEFCKVLRSVPQRIAQSRLASLIVYMRIATLLVRTKAANEAADAQSAMCTATSTGQSRGLSHSRRQINTKMVRAIVTAMLAPSEPMCTRRDMIVGLEHLTFLAMFIKLRLEHGFSSYHEISGKFSGRERLKIVILS
jgi:hypothetical protein